MSLCLLTEYLACQSLRDEYQSCKHDTYNHLQMTDGATFVLDKLAVIPSADNSIFKLACS